VMPDRHNAMHIRYATQRQHIVDSVRMPPFPRFASVYLSANELAHVLLSLARCAALPTPCLILSARALHHRPLRARRRTIPIIPSPRLWPQAHPALPLCPHRHVQREQRLEPRLHWCAAGAVGRIGFRRVGYVSMIHLRNPYQIHLSSLQGSHHLGHNFSCSTFSSSRFPSSSRRSHTRPRMRGR